MDSKELSQGVFDRLVQLPAVDRPEALELKDCPAGQHSGHGDASAAAAPGQIPTGENHKPNWKPLCTRLKQILPPTGAKVANCAKVVSARRIVRTPSQLAADLPSPPQRKNVMGSPQDARQRRRQRERRARKNIEWELKRARENDEAARPKAPPKTAT